MFDLFSFLNSLFRKKIIRIFFVTVSVFVSQMNIKCTSTFSDFFKFIGDANLFAF